MDPNDLCKLLISEKYDTSLTNFLSTSSNLSNLMVSARADNRFSGAMNIMDATIEITTPAIKRTNVKPTIVPIAILKSLKKRSLGTDCKINQSKP
ncbi:hypothetical protein D3C80_2016970 [compost metagenome]